MIKKILFLFFATCCLSLTIEKTTTETCNKNNSNDCHFFNWRPWGSCMGKCGYQNQTRERFFCCDSEVKPHTVENCLLHCNLSRQYPTNESQTCRVCLNGGTFHSVSTPCVCSPKYKGDCCQDKVKCSDNPCKHGTCSDQASNFFCTCNSGYKDIYCDTRKTCSEGITCQNSGTCQDGPNGFQCQCSKKFSGEFCEKPLTCSDDPCQNGGSCTNTGLSFRCKCPPSHSGDVCEKETAKSKELLLPKWFPYLEYSLLTLVSLTGVMAMGCVCLKCCQACGVIRDDDDDDDEKRVEDGSRKLKRDSIIPLDTKQPQMHNKRSGLDF